MIKHILGVHRWMSNDACRAELGLYPLKIEIQKRCVQFWGGGGGEGGGERDAVFCVLLSLRSAFQRVPAARSALHGTLNHVLGSTFL